jgi:SET domain
VDASELQEDKISVLLPLIDVTNHQPLAKVEWQAEKEYITFATMEDVPAGQEVGNNYGPRNNEQCTFHTRTVCRSVSMLLH